MARNKSRWGENAAGLQASVIGFVLVGSTAVGFGLGWWLDNQFGTTFWMPLLSMVGVAAGFRQMFLMLGEINEDAKKKKAQREAETSKIAETHQAAVKQAAEPPPVKPIFRVPPPPSASWEKQQEALPPNETDLENLDLENLDSAELIRQLMGEDDSDEEEKPTTDAT